MVYPTPKGFVGAASYAYSQHHDLVLGPDDVWQAIVTQFSFFVQGHAEELRHRFVSREGKKELIVYGIGNLLTANYKDLVEKMRKSIAKNIEDSSMEEWITPNFTTTMEADRVAASVSLMATMQHYFSYTFMLICGLPSVELLGTVTDWEHLVTKAKRLNEFDLPATGGHLTQWQSMLLPVLEEMVATHKGKDNMDWWQRICHYEGGGSGPTYLSGWITVFAVFDEKGLWQGDQKKFPTEDGSNAVQSDWPAVETGKLPSALLTCPVTVNDHGHKFYTDIFAGQFSFETATGKDVRPRTDWALAITNDQLMPASASEL